MPAKAIFLDEVDAMEQAAAVDGAATLAKARSRVSAMYGVASRFGTIQSRRLGRQRLGIAARDLCVRLLTAVDASRAAV
jgi:hypothetical protein